MHTTLYVFKKTNLIYNHQYYNNLVTNISRYYYHTIDKI